MSIKKFLITGSLIFGLVATQTGFSASAAEATSEDSSITDGTVSLDTESSNVEVSEVMTFDELVQEIAEDQGISKSEASNQVIASSPKKNSRTAAVAAAATYRTLSQTFTVTGTYKPAIKFYVQTTEGGSFRAIVKVLNVSLNRAHLGTGKSKQFGGTVYTYLEDPNRIYWEVNGDWYNNGTTTGGGSLNIGVGKAASLEFNLSNESNFFAYKDNTGYCRF